MLTELRALTNRACHPKEKAEQRQPGQEQARVRGRVASGGFTPEKGGGRRVPRAPPGTRRPPSADILDPCPSASASCFILDKATPSETLRRLRARCETFRFSVGMEECTVAASTCDVAEPYSVENYFSGL
ncbi:hypothetical protein EVAR_66882_1 [Eumeta japonica]|uniref:Uncharacterized protein n=1 Tax=Eumeta variegata TaxID=151549 RepID=A0A4C2A1W0_EUMVA|nr:hypothetical protein EVAR_66882_1 [Eumeta japonica]